MTGLTDDDVHGEGIGVERARALIDRSGLVVAHNARFERPFVERVLPAARVRPWACTRAVPRNFGGLLVLWLAAGTARAARPPVEPAPRLAGLLPGSLASGAPLPRLPAAPLAGFSLGPSLVVSVAVDSVTAPVAARGSLRNV